MRLERDTGQVAEYTGLHVSVDFASSDLHGGGVDPDARVTLGLVHRLMSLLIVGYLESQIIGCLGRIHAGVIETVSEYLATVGLEGFGVLADALDEEDAVAQLSREVVVDLGALIARHHGRVQYLQWIDG